MKPPVPPECNLRNFEFMPIDVVRLRDSGLVTENRPEICWFNFLSWCLSWHQQPAGSLPSDSRQLSRMLLSGSSAKHVERMDRLRRDGALRGWYECEDGRLYHPVVAEKVKQAWAMKQLHNKRAENARRAKADKAKMSNVSSNVSSVTGLNRQGQGQGQGQLIAEGGLPLPPIADMVDAKTAAAHIAEIAKADNVDHVAIAEAYVLSRRAKGWKLGDTLVSHWPADLESFYQSAKSNPRFEAEWITWCYQCWNDSESCICGPDEKNWHRVKLPCGPGVDKSYAARMEYIQEHFA